MGVFALLSMMSKNTEPPKSRKENRFIILIPAYKNGAGTLQTVHSILGQTYPQRLFDVTVISDHLDEMSNFRLAQEPITLLTPVFQKSSREAAGTRAIQAHRMSKNRDTAPARLSSIFEEINNSIFRRGHIYIGLSAACSNSAMAFDFSWFKKNIMTAKTSWDDKELEMLLLRQHIYVDYFDQPPATPLARLTSRNFHTQYPLSSRCYSQSSLRPDRQDSSMDATTPYDYDGCDCLYGNPHASHLLHPGP